MKQRYCDDEVDEFKHRRAFDEAFADAPQADSVTERHDNLAIAEEERCPSCRIGLGERHHHEGDAAVPECHYWNCERCGHQWGHE